MVTCFYAFGKWFLYLTILNQNASQLAKQIGQVLYQIAQQDLFDIRLLAFKGLASLKSANGKSFLRV